MPKKRVYNKKPLEYLELIKKLSSKGMVVDNVDEAIQLLRDIGFYRLVGYGLAFEEYAAEGKRRGQYKAGTQLSQLTDAYSVDRKLRSLILDAVAYIEIALRSCISYELSLKYSTAHWFLDPTLFSNSASFRHEDFLREVARCTGKTTQKGSDRDAIREQFIRHYYTEYKEPELPPIWMVAEVLSIGNWSKVFQHLRVSKDRKLISSQFDLAPQTLDSWLHCLTFIRNTCAHHSRLFARKLPLPPKQDKGLPLLSENYVFNYLCIIHYFMQQLEPQSNWLKRVGQALSESSVNLSYYGIGKKQQRLILANTSL